MLAPAQLRHFGDCACFNVRWFNRVLTQHFTKAMRTSGLQPTQLPLLARLAAGSASLAELTDWLAMDRTTLLRNLRPLERRGWVRDQAGRRGRARQLELAPSGHRLLAEVQPAWQRAQAQIEAAFGAGEWGRFMAKMEEVATRLEKSGPGSP
ncbi:MAG: winged helix-turn-helix transcriptional regulator [Opitutae bacterium]|nr:winged helix-turn-helix transcriptional regulator [Opitutae bacterium]